jgi:hypothetical protein
VTTPYAVVAAVATTELITKRQMLVRVRAFERAATSMAPRRVSATLQDVRFLSEETRRVYERLAAGGAEVTLFARDLPAYVAPGVTGVSLDDAHPLVDEWSVLVLGEEAGMAIVATDAHGDCGSPGASDTEDMDRTFTVATSRDRDVVRRCLEALETI